MFGTVCGAEDSIILILLSSKSVCLPVACTVDTTAINFPPQYHIYLFVKTSHHILLIACEQTPIAAVAFDVHGFTFGNNPAVNQVIQKEQARLLTQGCALIASTAFGERIKLYVSGPIKKLLEESHINTTTVPFYLSTRNGALTTHAFTGDVIDTHPIPDQMYGAITSRPLMKAADALANSEFKAGLQKGYEQIRQMGLAVHPHKDEHPGIRYDWHEPTQAGYQMSVLYDSATFLPDTDEKLEAYAITKIHS